MVGFGKMLLRHLGRFVKPSSVIVIEDPDIIGKRAVLDELGQIPCVRAVVPARYHQDLECVDAVTAFLDGARPTAVLSGLEYGVPAAAAIAARFGLPGATEAAARILCDKLRLRAATAAAGIRNPRWQEVRHADEVRRFAGGGPVVLKPANRHASLGVQLLRAGDDVAAAWRATVDARDDMMLPDHPLQWRYVAEQTVVGREYSAEVLVRDGDILFLNVTAKSTAGGRYPVELGHTVPAALSPELNTRFADDMARLVAAIGFGSGVLHAEWMVDDEGPVLIECAGRVPGDSIVDLIDSAYGFSLVHELVAVLSGRKPDCPAGPCQASAIRFLTAPPGHVQKVTGLAAAGRHPAVVRAGVSVAVGDRVSDLRSSWDRVGEVFVVGATPDLAVDYAAAAAALIRIITTEQSPVPSGALSDAHRA
jgi:biotin carboxylase